MQDDAEKRLDIAIAAIKKLKGLQNDFFSAFTDQSGPPLQVGSISTSGTDITATCLGVNLCVVNRQVVLDDGLPRAIEYSFIAKHNDESLKVFIMYLDARDGVLYMDSGLKSRLCDYDNVHLVKKVLDVVAAKLLDSPIFAPVSEN